MALSNRLDPGVTRCGGSEFRWGERTYVMGIINVTPDSFSGDGLGGDVEAAVAQGKRFAAEGADILDVGGESTRPNAEPVCAEEELRRVIPVIERLAGEVSVPVSVDTYRYEVAQRALAAGASMINDIWGLGHEPRLANLAAEHGVPMVLMSNQRGRTVSGHRAGGHRRPEEEHGRGNGPGSAPAEHHRRSRRRLRQDAGTEPGDRAAPG